MINFSEKEHLYHYTSFSALEGILKTKSIWLGNLRYMNDRREIDYFFDQLKKSLTEELPDYQDVIETLFADQLRRFKGKTAYAFCMSITEDDASQWDRYACQGKGVCIKFRIDYLEERIKGNAVIQPVFYANDLKKHQITAVLERYITEGELWNSFQTVDEVFDEAWISSVAFKHPSFSAEKEVRICSYPFLTEGISTGEFKYVTNENGLREYYPIDLCSEIERNYGETIEEIRLGPCSGVDVNMFYRYLQVLGVDCRSISISESKCPLR